MSSRKAKSRPFIHSKENDSFSRLECIYLLIFQCTELFMRKASKAWSVDRIQIVTEECWFVCSCLFFSAGILKLNFNDTLVSSTHTFPVNIFNLEGGETMLARDKRNFQALIQNRTRNPLVEWLERPIQTCYNESRRPIQYSEGREFNSRRGYEIFRFPGEHGFSSFQVENVQWKCMCAAHQCVIKINKNKSKIYLRNHEFVRKKQNGG